MRKMLVSVLLLVVVSLASAQDLGAAWYVTKGRAEPVVLAPVGRVDDFLGLPWLDLDLSIMVRPLDGFRLGGSVTFSAPVAKNAWLTVGVGALASDVFTWDSLRPGLVLGVTVRF